MYRRDYPDIPGMFDARFSEYNRPSIYREFQNTWLISIIGTADCSPILAAVLRIRSFWPEPIKKTPTQALASLFKKKSWQQIFLIFMILNILVSQFFTFFCFKCYRIVLFKMLLFCLFNVLTFEINIIIPVVFFLIGRICH